MLSPGLGTSKGQPCAALLAPAFSQSTMGLTFSYIQFFLYASLSVSSNLVYFMSFRSSSSAAETYCCNIGLNEILRDYFIASCTGTDIVVLRPTGKLIFP